MGYRPGTLVLPQRVEVVSALVNFIFMERVMFLFLCKIELAKTLDTDLKSYVFSLVLRISKCCQHYEPIGTSDVSHHFEAAKLHRTLSFRLLY